MVRIIVDIDNTLWDFATVFYEHLRRINSSVPAPNQWYDWDFLTSYFTKKQAYTTIHEVQMCQDTFAPYPEAHWFLSSLKERGFYIIIASHRRQETLRATTAWLEKNGLLYDEIHLSFDKSVLFDSSWGIVDDSPIALTKAQEAGIVRTGLRHPWNTYEEHELFDSLGGVLEYLELQKRYLI